MNDVIMKLEAENAALKAELHLLKDAAVTRLLRDCSPEQKRYYVRTELRYGDSSKGVNKIPAINLYMALFNVDMCTAYEEVEKLKDA